MISVYNESLICDCDGAEILRPWGYVSIPYEHTRRHFVYWKPQFPLSKTCRDSRSLKTPGQQRRCTKSDHRAVSNYYCTCQASFDTNSPSVVSVSPWFQTASASLKSKTNSLYINTSLENACCGLGHRVNLIYCVFTAVIGIQSLSVMQCYNLLYFL